MKTRPVELSFISLTLVLITMGIPVQFYFLYQHSLETVTTLFLQITPLNWIVMGLCMMNAFISWRGNKMLKYTLAVNVFFIVINNLHASAVGDDYSHQQTMTASLFAVGLYLIIFRSQIWQLLHAPIQRWWLIPKRNQVTLPIEIVFDDLTMVKGKTFDLSKTGVYISFDSLNPQTILWAHKELLTPDHSFNFFLEDRHHRSKKCTGKLVRMQETSRGHYPPGFALEFL
jgi:hypothetical protein